MAERPTDVLVAGYKDIDEATRDFEALVELVKEKEVSIEGVILVTHDEDGNVAVQRTGDNLGRKGTGWGGGVGLAVGLFAPPLLASVAVGAVAGRVVARFAGNKVENELRDKIGENLPPGSAGIIAIFDDEQRLGVERALAGAMLRSVVQGDKKGIGALKESLAEAMGKFTPDRTVLPIPDPNFGGAIGRTLDASVADWTINMTPSPPEGAPNVLLVLIDDAGFGQPVDIRRARLDAGDDAGRRAGPQVQRASTSSRMLADRAALLTGRNHHTVGFGSIGEFPGPFPGYSASVPKDCAPFVRALQGNGYSTAGFGKLAPDPRSRPGCSRAVRPLAERVGIRSLLGHPRRRGRPVRPGDHAGQHDPSASRRARTAKEYYWPDDLTDQAVRWLHEVRAQDQEKPWFIYYSTGCSHAPHQVAVEWSEKYRGKFDQGWDVLREETFERQKTLGVIPPDAVLTPRPDALPAWDSLSDARRRCTRGRWRSMPASRRTPTGMSAALLDAVEELGELDNTLVIYIFGDNGASLEGTLTGSFNELTMQNGIALTPEQQLSLIEQYGGLDAWGTTRTRRTTRPPGRGPGTRRSSGASSAPPTSAARATARSSRGRSGSRTPAGCAPSSLTASTSGRRSSKRPVSPSPRSWTGPPKSRWRGRASSTPSTTRTQRSATPCSTSRSSATGRSTRTAGGPPASSTAFRGTFRRRRWRGSHPEPTTRSRTPGSCTTCPTTSVRRMDLAAENPEKLAELKELFWEEAEKHNVLPLLAALSVFFGILPPMPTITTQTFYGDVQNIASGMIPRVYGRSYAIEAELSVPEDGAEGVIVAEADEMGGFSLWVDENGLLHHSYSLMGVERYEQVSTEPIPTGDVTVRMLFDADRQERSAGGTVSLYANDEKIGEGRIERTVAVRFSGYAGMDVGRDNGLPVARAYSARSPYPFTGTVKKVVFDLKPGTRQDEMALHEGGAHVAAARGSAPRRRNGLPAVAAFDLYMPIAW